MLYIAAYVASPGMVRFLLQRGADVNMRNLDGRTALHCVMHQGYSAGFNRNLAALLELLLKSGADTGLRSDDGYTARDIAVMRGLHRVVDILDSARGPTAATTTAAAVAADILDSARRSTAATTTVTAVAAVSVRRC